MLPVDADSCNVPASSFVVVVVAVVVVVVGARPVNF